MKEHWIDEEREPRRSLQIFDAEAQTAFKNMTIKDKLEWLQSINEIYWANRMSQSLPKAAESRRPYSKK